jgi:cytochrome c-type biogenesis protein CcsB
MERRYRITGLGVFVCTLAVIAIVCGSALPKGVNATLMTMIQNRWSGIHITSSLLSYASFALAFGAALGYGLQERLLKTKRLSGLRARLPSLDTVDRFAYKCVAIGFPMLTLGVVTGAMWARTAWGAYWSWDPKETWSLITWLVYAAYLHIRIVQGWRGKWANRLLIAGFVCILMTYLGVNFLPQGLHKYTW